MVSLKLTANSRMDATSRVVGLPSAELRCWGTPQEFFGIFSSHSYAFYSSCLIKPVLGGPIEKSTGRVMQKAASTHGLHGHSYQGGSSCDSNYKWMRDYQRR